MHIERITHQVSVSDQITVADVQTLLDEGVELLVCNRPDGEAPDQTPYAEIEAEANRLGLEIEFVAFSSYQIVPEYRDQFIKLIETRKRIHSYCRTGARSRRLWREANSLVGGEAEYDLLHKPG